MATYDNTYSRVVAWLKILLPLLALAILSTLFLVARTIDPAQNIPYAEVDIEQLTREQRIGKPNYSGLTTDGAAITLSAAKAMPDPALPDKVLADDVRAGIDLPTGTRIDVTARAAMVDGRAKTAGLSGGVTLVASDGYRMQTERLDVALGQTRIAAPEGVLVTAPFGTITAGQFILSGDGAAGDRYLLVFKDRVKLVYTPQN